MNKISKRKRRLASLHFCRLFLGREPGLGAGVAARFAKAPVGISALPQRNQMGFRKERPARSYGKTGASWFCEVWRCPRALVKLWNSLNPFYFLKSEGGQGDIFP